MIEDRSDAGDPSVGAVTGLRAALYQGPYSDATQPVSELVSAIGDAAAAAARASAQVVVCPEMSATGYNIGALVAERAEPADGPIARAVADIARRSAVAVAYGYPERTQDAVYNSVQVMGPDGRPLANYRKTHLFGALDRDHFAPGETLVVQFDLAGVRCGLAICYDVEFPEVVRAHADSGTQWLVVPTGLMSPYEHVADALVPARAYESQLFVSYVNRCGPENGLGFCGSSVSASPDGSVTRAGRDEQTLIVDIDVGAIDESRSVNTHLADRRHDLYDRFTLSDRRIR